MKYSCCQNKYLNSQQKNTIQRTNMCSYNTSIGCIRMGNSGHVYGKYTQEKNFQGTKQKWRREIREEQTNPRRLVAEKKFYKRVGLSNSLGKETTDRYKFHDSDIRLRHTNTSMWFMILSFADKAEVIKNIYNIIYKNMFYNFFFRSYF